MPSHSLAGDTRLTEKHPCAYSRGKLGGHGIRNELARTRLDLASASTMRILWYLADDAL